MRTGVEVLSTSACLWWLCALLAMPRKPVHDDEVQLLVYLRLRGRQQVLTLLAAVGSAWSLVGWLVLLLGW